MCYCPPTGNGKLVCGKYPSCDENTGTGPQRVDAEQPQENGNYSSSLIYCDEVDGNLYLENQGLQASIRMIDARGKADGYGNTYPLYGEGFATGYNGYPDYGAYMRQQQQLQQQQSQPAESEAVGEKKDAVVPDLTPVDGTGNKVDGSNQQGAGYGVGPYNPYQNPYGGYENTGGYFDPQNPYPAYGYNDNGYGYNQGYNNPYPAQDSNNKAGAEKKTEDEANEDEESNAENSKVVKPKSSVDEPANKIATNANANSYQQMYPYYQQQGGYGGYQGPYTGGSFGYPNYPLPAGSEKGEAGSEANGFAQNYYGNSVYNRQGQQTGLNPNQAKLPEGKSKGESGTNDGVHPSDASLTNQQNGLYPYNPYAGYDPQLGTNLGSPKAPQTTGDIAAQGTQNVGDVATPKETEDKTNDADAGVQNPVNSISNPYLDPNYNPRLSGYGQAGQYPAQNIYPYNGYAGYYPEAAGSASAGSKDAKTSQDGEAVPVAKDNAEKPASDSQGNDLPNGVNPYAGYQQQLGGYYPYDNPYYNQYNNPYGGYNMQQGDLYAQNQQNSQDAKILRPSKETVVPGLVGVDDSSNRVLSNTETQLPTQETESGIKRVFLEHKAPIVEKQRLI